MMSRESEPPTEWIPQQEILNRLKRLSAEGDGAVIDDVYDLALRQLAGEDAHTAKLDARASSLFGAVGFSMTVAFSFGGWALLDNARKVPYGNAIAAGFVIVLLVGLVTSGFALSGLKLSKGHVVPDEKDVFNDTMMRTGRKRSEYRLYIATHLWGIWQQRHDRNEQRAQRILTGQVLFFGFLAAILGLSAFTTMSAIKRRPDSVPGLPTCNVVLTAPSLVSANPMAYGVGVFGVPDAGVPEIAPQHNGASSAPTRANAAPGDATVHTAASTGSRSGSNRLGGDSP